jgi:hypothetical protein
VRQYLSALAFVVTLVVVVGASGCGQRVAGGSNQAPAGADLAADALASLQERGSAHFVLDVKTTAAGYSQEAPFSLHVEGEASAHALDAEGSIGFGGFSVTGHVLADEHNLFVEFMNEWYGEDQGIANAFEQAKKERNGASPWNDWATPEGLRRNFDELFTGTVSAGPLVGGVETWKFEGRFSADGITHLEQRYGEAARPDLNQKMAEASRLVLVVGRDDHLPRRVEFTVKLSADDLKGLSNDGAANFETTLELSDFGKTVAVNAPEQFKPLNALFDKLFSGFE